MPLLYLVGPYAQRAHQRVAEYLLTEVASLHGLHGKHGYALFVVNISQGMAHTVVDALGIGHNHNALYVFLCTYKLYRLNEEIVLADNVLNGKRADKELSQIVFKRHAVKFVGIFRRLEIVKPVPVLAVYQNHLRLVFTLTQSSV